MEFLDVESNGKKIKNISGLEQIREIKEVREIQLEFKIGDIVEKAQDDRSRAGFFIVCGETREKTPSKHAWISPRLKLSAGNVL